VLPSLLPPPRNPPAADAAAQLAAQAPPADGSALTCVKAADRRKTLLPAGRFVSLTRAAMHGDAASVSRALGTET
jgi:hypothetical protein